MGKAQVSGMNTPSFDTKTGPAAVVRNLQVVLRDVDIDAEGWRVVTIDRFYTSIALLLQLLKMGMYAVGTIMTNKIGYCKPVVNRNTGKDLEPRGSFRYATAVDVPSMIALSWVDKKPVHFLATGATCAHSSVRRYVGRSYEQVACPQIVTDYHKLMGGVDRHDQLRLQRYALQTSHRFRKYYKCLFMGLVDLVIVNCYVTHCACAKRKGVAPLKRADFMTRLHTELLQVTAADFADPNQPPTPSSRTSRFHHTIVQNHDFRGEGKDRRRRRNACKVCSIKFRQKGRKSNESSWYCLQCSEGNKKMFLCNMIRSVEGNTKTCFDIWHNDWRCKKPASAKNNIQMRPTTGGRKPKRRRRLLQNDEASQQSMDDSDFE
jgi:hypothetical protein